MGRWFMEQVQFQFSKGVSSLLLACDTSFKWLLYPLFWTNFGQTDE